MRLVSEVRSARTELNVPPSAKLHLFAADASDETADRLDRNHAMLSRLARLESIQLSAFAGQGAAQMVVDEATFALPLEGVIDIGSEIATPRQGRRRRRERARQPRHATVQSELHRTRQARSSRKSSLGP